MMHMRGCVLAAAGVVAVAGSAMAQSFTAGNLVISMVDMPSSTNAARPVTLQQFDLSGLLSASLNASRAYAMPSVSTSSNDPAVLGNSFMLSGSATSEGLLTLSADRSALNIGGYSTFVGARGPSTSALQSIASSLNSSANLSTGVLAGTGDAAGSPLRVQGNVARTFATVPANYSATTFTRLDNTYSGSNIRSAYTTASGSVLLGGTSLINTSANRASGGARIWTSGSSTTALTGPQGTDTNNPTFVNTRMVQDGPGGAIFAATQSSSTAGGFSPGIVSISGNTATNLPGMSVSTGSLAPNDFAFMGASTIYVADEGSAGTGVGQWGGLQRWDLIAGNWTLAYVINNVGGAFAGLRSLTVVQDPASGSSVIYGITSESSPRLVGVVDVGAASQFTVLASAPQGFVFRSVEMTPGTVVPTPAGAALLGLGALAAARRRRA